MCVCVAGKLNYLGSSHQWWHLMVVLAFAWTHHMTTLVFLYWSSHPCPATLVPLEDSTSRLLTVALTDSAWSHELGCSNFYQDIVGFQHLLRLSLFIFDFIAVPYIPPLIFSLNLNFKYWECDDRVRIASACAEYRPKMLSAAHQSSQDRDKTEDQRKTERDRSQGFSRGWKCEG